MRIDPYAIGDPEALQAFLEDAHSAMNRAACRSYNICDYCAEPDRIRRFSTTPCADAFFLMFLRTGSALVFSFAE